MRLFLKNMITYHWLTTLLILCISVFVFSVSSVNIFFLLKANLGFIAEHGSAALAEGAFGQLTELISHSLLSAVFYVIFKACERVLVEKLLR